jgi:hypothetical protein
MTPTPLDATPQGAQLKRYDCYYHDEYGYPVKVPYAESGTGYWTKWEDVASLAERIEKLEREKDEIEQQAIAAGIAWAYERDALKAERNANLNSWGKERYELMAERDTALRALAEARRDAATSKNYVADLEVFPRTVTFANGRVVRVVGTGHLEIDYET